MNRIHWRKACVLALFGPLLLEPPLCAHPEEDLHTHHTAKTDNPQVMETRATDVTLVDLELVDQNGARIMFKSEAIGERLVAINFMYTTCKVACPIQSPIFTTLQEALGDRLGREVFLISISIDPTTDIPQRLKEYADKYRAKPGWIFLTGKKQNLDRVVAGLGNYSSDITEHPPMVLVGDGRLGGWTRFYGFPKPEQLLARLDELLAKRQTNPLLLASSPVGEQEKRGKQIYSEGKGTHPIFAHLPGPNLTVPGENFPCLTCHLENGVGSREGGVQAPDITYAHLTSEYTGVRATGRSHPPYNDERLKIAIQKGIDPAGHPLHPAMPRYTMSSEDLSDLIAYLKLLGHEPVPGVTDREIRIGMIRPKGGPLGEIGDSVREILSAYFEDLNNRGGIYGREIRLVVIDFDPSRGGSAETAVRNLLAQDPVFCFVANVGLFHEEEVVEFIASQKIPVIAPLVLIPDSAYAAERQTFSLFSSIHDQARVMVDFTAHDLKKAQAPVAVLYADDRVGKAGAAGVKEQIKKHHLTLVADQPFPAQGLTATKSVSELKRATPEVVYFFGNGTDALAFIWAADRQKWHPVIFVSSELSGLSLLSLPDRLAKSVYLVSSVSEPDLTSTGMADFLRLVTQFKIPRRHRIFQMAAFAGASLLEEGLTLSGRSLTRNRLVEQIDTLWKFATGVTPPLTYNKNRHVGVVGGRIVRIDTHNQHLIATTGWREPE